MRKAMILGGALARPRPRAGVDSASAAAPTDSTRGDVIPCAIPHVPGPATVLGSGRKQGAVYHRKYSITGTSPLQVGVLYYLRNLPRRGYQIQAGRWRVQHRQVRRQRFRGHRPRQAMRLCGHRRRLPA